MEPETKQNGNDEVTQAGDFATRHNLNRVTAVSKYLALALFIALPFLGGYIGYVYAPEKVVEVERVVEVEGSFDIQRDEDERENFVFVTESVSIPISDNRVMNVDIAAQQNFHTAILYSDYLNFDANTGLISLKDIWYEGGSEELAKVYYNQNVSDIETAIEDIEISKSTAEQGSEENYDKYLAELLNDYGYETMTYREFCKLSSFEYDEYSDLVWYRLGYDREYYSGDFELDIRSLFICGSHTFFVVDNIIVESYSVPIDAMQPKIINDTVYLTS